MLRDLEARKAPEREGLSSLDATSRLIESKQPVRKMYIVLSSVLLIGVGVGLSWFFNMPSTDVVAVKDKETKVTEVAISSPTGALVSDKSNTVSEPVLPKPTKVEPDPVSDKQQVTPKVVLASDKIEVSAPIPKTRVAKLTPSAKTPRVLTTKVQNIPQVPKPVVKLKPTVSPRAMDQNNAELALKFFKENEPRNAYRILYDFMESHSVDTKSRTMLVRHLLQDERIAEAGDILVTTPVDRNPELRQMKARWYVARGENTMALHTLRSNLPVLDDFPDYYSLLASYYQRFGFAAKAAEIYASLVQYDDSANWWAGLAIALDSSKQYSDAVEAYKRALAIPELNIELIEYIENRLSVLSASY